MHTLPAPYAYVTSDGGEGYVWLALDSSMFGLLPERIHVSGVELAKRPEFHVTLGNIHSIMSRVPGASEHALIESFEEYVAAHPITFKRFLDDIRFVSKNDRRSVVICCEVDGLDGLYEAWEALFGVPILRQPTHVTIYSLASGKGIGINTPAEMQALPQVELPEVSQALARK